MAKIVSIDSVAFDQSNDSVVSVFLQVRTSSAFKDEIHDLLFWKVRVEEEGAKNEMFAAPSQCVECEALRRWEHIDDSGIWIFEEGWSADVPRAVAIMTGVHHRLSGTGRRTLDNWVSVGVREDSGRKVKMQWQP
jgi:hypothetical protein